MSLTSLTPPETFWVPLVAGVLAAIVVVGFLIASPIPDLDKQGYRTKTILRARQRDWWVRGVWTSTTWSFKDSWATNITAIGSVLGIVAGASNPATALGTASPSKDLVALGIVFGGAAVLAPLVYAALAKAPPRDDAPESPQVQGSVFGLLVADMITVFASMGGLAAFATFVDTSSVTVGERWSLIGATTVAAAFIALYAVRSFRALVDVGKPRDPKHRRTSLMNAEGNSATI